MAGKDSLPFLVVPLVVQKHFNIMMSRLSMIGLNSWENGVLFRSSFPTPVSCRELCMLSPRSFNVSGFTLKPLIHLEFIFVWSDRCGLDFILLHVDILLSQNSFLKMLFDLQCLFWASLSSVRWLQRHVLTFVFVSTCLLLC